jgi:hypothetical protein
MKSIDIASKEHEQQFGFNSVGEINSSPAESFKAGVEFAQQWVDINKEIPEYYQPILADNGIFVAVVARVSDGENEYYPISDTNEIMNPQPIKWRKINIL